MSEVPFQAIKSNGFTGLFHGFSTVTVTHLNKSDHHPTTLSDTNPIYFSPGTRNGRSASHLHTIQYSSF